MDHSDEEAHKLMRRYTTKQMCDAYLDRLIEEDDPKNEIEEDYKAKGNKVLMWQCRRLFCQQHLRIYAQKELNNKPDFMDAVRLVKGVKAPAELQPAVDGATKQDGAADPADDPNSGGVDGTANDAAVTDSAVCEPSPEA